VLVRYSLQGTRSDLAFLHRLCGYYSEVMSHMQAKSLPLHVDSVVRAIVLQ
jgi:hypothetical protein